MSIPIYVISLPDAQERRSAMTDRLSALGLQFQFFDAVDGRNGLPASQEFPAIDVNRFASNTAVACTLSHHLLHKHIVSQQHDWALILEDDVAFSDDLSHILDIAKQCVDYDIVKLEGLRPLRYFVPVRKCEKYLFAIPHAVSAGAAGYLVSQKAAAKLASQTILREPIDTCFEDVSFAWKVLEIEPRPIWQDTSFASSNLPVRCLTRPSKLKRLKILIANTKNSLMLYGLKFIVSILRQRLRSGVR